MSPRALAGFSGLMLLAMLATFATGIFVAEKTPLLANHVAREIARVEQTGGLYYFDNGYVDEGDYVLLEKLNNDDYSRGGVYFIGTSELQAGFADWMMTPAEAELIHNYSIGNLRHREAGQYLRMLVEENNLLEAGGEKTTIILSLNFQLTRIDREEMYAPNLFRRHGLYTFDREAGIHKVNMPAWRRWLILRRRGVAISSGRPLLRRHGVRPAFGRRARLVWCGSGARELSRSARLSRLGLLGGGVARGSASFAVPFTSW